MARELPENWKEATLRSVCEPTCMWNPQREQRDEFWYVDVSAVSRHSFAIREPQRVKAPQAPSRARKIIQTGDCIFATVRPRLRRVAFVDNQFDNQIASTAFCIVRANRAEAVPRFLYYVLLTDLINEAIAKFESGASYPAVTDNDVLNRTIPLPPKPEQEKIAAVLWKIQRATEAEERLIKTVRELKKSTMRQLFSRGLRGEPQKETQIGAVPQNWRVDELIHLVHFQRGFDITKNSQSHGTIPVVSSGGIKSWHSEAAATAPGVVLGRKGSIGSIHYVEQDYWPHDTTLWATDFRGNDPLFVYYRLSVLDLKRLDSGAANPALNRNFLHAELVSWPNAQEQHEIAGILQTIDRKIAVHKRKHMILQELFQTLLNQLMIGQIRVYEFDIDVSEIKP